MDIVLKIQLHANQMVMHKSPALHKVVKAGKRFGKTKWALFELIQAAGRKPGGVFWYIAPTYGMAEAIGWKELNEIIPQGLVRRSVENKLLKELVNGAVIRLLGADNQNSLRGPGLDGVVFDEAAYIDYYCWEGIVSNQLLKPKGQPSGFAYFISSPNSKGRNWFTRFHEDAMAKMQAGHPDWAAWHFTTYDNPILDPAYIDELKRDCTDQTWNIEHLAIEPENTGIIYTEFNEGRDVATYASKNSLILTRWLDWGIDHPTTCLFGEVDQEAKIVYISDEFGASGMSIEESCQVIRSMTGNRVPAWSIIDPSTNKRNSQTKITDHKEFANHGIYCLLGNNRASGYDTAKLFLKKGMVKIHPKCRNLINQLRNLQWTDKTGDDYTDPFRYGLVHIRDLYFKEVFKEIEERKVIAPPANPLELNFNDPILFPKKRHENEANGWIQDEIEHLNAA